MGEPEHRDRREDEAAGEALPTGWPPDAAPANRQPVRRVIATELTHHLPWSIAGAVLGLAAVWTLLQLRVLAAGGAEPLFHLLHPIHLLLSATATTAMVVVAGGNRVRAIVVGLLGSVPICSVSDVVLPFAGGQLLGAHMHFHLCVLDHPLLIVPFVAVGIGCGLVAPRFVARSTFYSHAGHVLVSAMASILYLVSFGLVLGIGNLALVFVVLLGSVLIPCCASDIVIPLLLGRPACPHAGHAH